MAQAIAETIFDICYLVGVITAGYIMMTKGKSNGLVKKFGIMAVLLGVGDSFHLVPRMVALWTTGLEANAAALGIGKLVTSITMTIFYLILYYIWRERYEVEGRKPVTIILWALAIIRIGLCLLPQNQWLSYHQPLKWGIIRNVPFAIMGFMIIMLFAHLVKRKDDKVFRFMPLAIALSFAFYIPVVLFSAEYPLVGMLMIPKTLAYVWIVYMGWKLYKETV
ncbi:hypothetical protein AOC36_00610 [Erysipelothrix larvae]|uniref:Uncharacterized protein n=1 Tax=Erysipelothrix larvae TaxID=1514105 RepID=A0A0X8GY25_9FIRM|nr:hypothetical protein [Erysipelothrix larvae]AMC92545.1 hypothetical protein AOC36_00610 [Erysipelothrix larvae]